MVVSMIPVNASPTMNGVMESPSACMEMTRKVAVWAVILVAMSVGLPPGILLTLSAWITCPGVTVMKIATMAAMKLDVSD